MFLCSSFVIAIHVQVTKQTYFFTKQSDKFHERRIVPHTTQKRNMKEQMPIKQKAKSAQMDLKMKFYYINGVWRSFHILSIFMIVLVKKETLLVIFRT